jgi:SWI/SNF-related matrix-associated actin-dependent regulator 1 of chromatin subfamily A
MQVKDIYVNNKWYVEYPLEDDTAFPNIPKRTAVSNLVPITLVNLGILHDKGYSFSESLMAKKVQMQDKNSPVSVTLPDVLMPFQKEGVTKLLAKKKGGLLADEQGLGKTIQLITYIAYKPELRPAVVVCPAHLKWNWKAEFNKWQPLINVDVLESNTPYETSGEVLIVNYEIVKSWVSYFNNLGVKLVICDEAQKIKNRKAISTQAVLSIGDNPVRIMATGTPLINNPENVWALVDAIDKRLLGGWTNFINYFCIVTKRPLYGKNGKQVRINGHPIMIPQIGSAKHMAVLHKVLASSVMIRRTKAEVLPQLPKKIKTVLPVSVNINGKTERTAQNLILSADTESQVQEAYSKLHKELGIAKIDAAIEWIEDFLESSTEQLVVMGWHRDVTTAIYEKFKDQSVLVIGGVTNKQELVEAFQKGQKRIFIGNIIAAGTGITLTSASTMLFVELPMTPADLAQASDRIHRIGQDQICMYYYLVGKGTLEEKIVKLLDEKADIASQVIDGVMVTESLGNLLKLAIAEGK